MTSTEGAHTLPTPARIPLELRVRRASFALVFLVALESLEMDAPALEAALVLTTRFDRFPMGFVELGPAYERLDQPQLAEAAFRRALRLAPGSEEMAAGLERRSPALEPAAAND